MRKKHHLVFEATINKTEKLFPEKFQNCDNFFVFHFINFYMFLQAWTSYFEILQDFSNRLIRHK